MDIRKSNLDNISRPTSNRSRQGSRASSMFGSAHTVNRRLIESPGTFQILQPDQSQEYEIEVEDFSGGSDLEDILSDFSDDGEFFEDYEGESLTMEDDDQDGQPQASGFTEPSLPQEQKENQDNVEQYLNKQLVYEGYENEDAEVNSEEERDICKEIKEEIKRQVRGEMADELKVYQLPSSTGHDAKVDENADLVDLEPKLREAIIKMRKLDKILLRKMKREKEVKRNRIRLQRRLRQELEDLSKEQGETGKKETREVKYNTFKFLALAPPPSHNEGVELDDNEDDPPVTPVFRTQLPDQDFQPKEEQKESTQSHGNRSQASSSRSEDSRASGPLGSELGGSTARSGTSNRSRRSKLHNKGSKKKQDFIKRNIQLASDAGNPVAMTDDEKKRLEDLLETLNMETIAEEGSMDNPYQVAVHPGEGYTPAPEDQKALKDIDERLKSLMAPEEFQAITTPQHETILQHCLFTRTDMRSSVDVDKLGEQALKETKDGRDMKVRLEHIEKELASLSIHADIEFQSPMLSEEQLELLLGQYARSVSSSVSMDTVTENGETLTERSDATSLDIYENPPTLPGDVLQKLLTEAREQLAIENHAPTPTTPNESDDRKVEKILNTARDDVAVDSLTDEEIQELLRCARQSSRASSRSSVHQSASSEILTQRNDLSRGTPEKEERVILPEIHRNNSITAPKVNNTQKLNNQTKKLSSAERRSANIVWNSFSDDCAPSHRDTNGRITNTTSVNLNGFSFDSHSPRPPPSSGSVGPPLLNSSNSARSHRSRGQSGKARPRNLEPISTHLDLDGLSDEDF